MISIYGAQAAQGLHVYSPHGLTACLVLSHKWKIDIRRAFIYDPIQALNVQKNPMAVSNQEKLQILKGSLPPLRTCVISDSNKDMSNHRY